ncbi:MAG: SPFH domain-containing protein [Anaerolineae bacterium]|nr:SPFH domain-containing protein [Thermoflexales bacterium]MDW8408506.1 SPFH domain-containing protein [Anaerolineae bacterium]
MPRVIDVIEWPDQGPNEIVRRVPEQGQGDIRLGSQVIVRGAQVAVFYRDGKALDSFKEGRHTLSTANLPLLSSLIGLATNSKTPFPAEVYFVTTKDFLDMKWGTPGEITVPDSVLGMVQLRAFGTYSMAISDPIRFVNQVVGVQGMYTTAQINDYLRGVMLSEVASVIGNVMKTRSLLDLAALQADLGAAIQAKAVDDFDALGIQLKKVYVVQVQPSEETAKAIAQRSAMGALGVNYMQYQAGQAMREAAQNEGSGVAGAGVGLGAGIGVGQVLGQAVAAGMTQPSPGQAQPQQPQQSQQAASPSGVQTKAQIRAAMTNLDIRLANGEISEATYNRLYENLSKALETAPD